VRILGLNFYPIFCAVIMASNSAQAERLLIDAESVNTLQFRAISVIAGGSIDDAMRNGVTSFAEDEFQRNRENSERKATLEAKVTEMRQYADVDIDFQRIPVQLGEYNFERRSFTLVVPDVLFVKKVGAPGFSDGNGMLQFSVQWSDPIGGTCLGCDNASYTEVWNDTHENKIFIGSQLAIPIDDVGKAEQFKRNYAESIVASFKCDVEEIGRYGPSTIVCWTWDIQLTDLRGGEIVSIKYFGSDAGWVYEWPK
jgi:hypothetical protein